LKDNKLKINRIGEIGEAVMTYQDPCYLGRYNDIYKPPRQLLKSLPGVTLVEMEHTRNDGFCCGGGGGRMWLEENTGQRISEMRLNQAISTKAALIATACPFCLQMFEDATRGKDASSSLRVKDIAEIVAEASGISKNSRTKPENCKLDGH
jgi:Fe-S oxidoreductase